MKRIRLLAIIVAIGAGTLQASAQEVIKQAFQNLINTMGVTSSHSISQERDVTKPGRPMKSLLNVYNFSAEVMLPLGKKDPEFIKDVLQAFEQERTNPNCYYVKTHSAGTEDWHNIMYGDNPNNYYEIGRDKWSDYIIISFLDPEDETQTHRYCYVMQWRLTNANAYSKKKGSLQFIKGVLVETYALVPKLTSTNDKVLYHGSMSTTKKEESTVVSASNLKGNKQQAISYNVKNADEMDALFNKITEDYLSGELRNRLLNAITIKVICAYPNNWYGAGMQKNGVKKIEVLIKKTGPTDPDYEECLAQLKRAKVLMEKNLKEKAKDGALNSLIKQAEKDFEVAEKDFAEAEKDIKQAMRHIDQALRDGTAKVVKVK
ncbi:MAG: hypothetical protein IJ244_06865 [Bacteroidaceae bacterium]|nr:hypothetical protein [Bacteroidaceae bacterium]